MAHDKSPPPPTPSNCEFCGNPHEIIIRGKIGGLKARICGACVILYAEELVRRAEAFEAGRAE